MHEMDLTQTERGVNLPFWTDVLWILGAVITFVFCVCVVLLAVCTVWVYGARVREYLVKRSNQCNGEQT